MITPNAALPITSGASKINQAVIPDMTFKIDFNALTVVNDFTSFKAVYGSFCGEIDYTLKYLTGKRNGESNNKDLSLINLDKVLTKLTITPSMLQTQAPPHEVYDHSYIGEHELLLEVSWVNSQAFPILVPLPVSHPVLRPFKVFITTICLETALVDITPRLDPIVNFKVYDELDWNVLTVDGFMDVKSMLAINSYGRPTPPAQVQFCGKSAYTSKVKSWRPTVFSEL